MDIKYFWTEVNRDGECWNWEGGVSKSSYPKVRYGKLLYKGREFKAHRMAYCLHHNIKPEKLTGKLKQVCGNPLCCRPAHIKLIISGKPKGCCKPGALGFEEAKKIRVRLAKGESARQLAYEYHVNESAICDIRKNKSYYDPNYKYISRYVPKLSREKVGKIYKLDRKGLVQAKIGVVINHHQTTVGRYINDAR